MTGEIFVVQELVESKRNLSSFLALFSLSFPLGFSSSTVLLFCCSRKQKRKETGLSAWSEWVSESPVVRLLPAAKLGDCFVVGDEIESVHDRHIRQRHVEVHFLLWITKQVFGNLREEELAAYWDVKRRLKRANSRRLVLVRSTFTFSFSFIIHVSSLWLPACGWQEILFFSLTSFCLSKIRLQSTSMA